MSIQYYFSCCVIFCIVSLSSCTKTESSTTSDDAIQQIIDQLSLEEKIGQMTNLTLTTLRSEDSNDTLFLLDSIKLRDVLVNHHIGSIQNVHAHAYTLNTWREIVTTIQKVTLEESSHKIPSLYCIDAVHGTNYTIGSTLFPQNIGLAATRDEQLVQKCGAITAMETRASGIRYNFSTVLDVGRQPLWPRFNETFGEDPVICTKLGTASIKGLEGKDLSSPTQVASCMKHFLGYAVPRNGKDRSSTYIPDIELHEYFVPPFRAGVIAGASTLMVSSGDINGIPVHASKELLTDLLRGEMGFEGVVISDWQDVVKLVNRHHVAKDHKEAVYQSVTAGIDMCIVPYDFAFYDDLIQLVKEGRIPESRIDESVRRILQLKKNLGLFEMPYLEKEAVANFGKPEYQTIALQAAEASMTLLKNTNDILPLNSNSKIYVTGPLATSRTALHGGWSYTWQGQKDDYFNKGTLNVMQAFEKSGQPLARTPQSADVIVVCIGEDAYAETPGNITDLTLQQSQLNLVQSLSKQGKPVILVLIEGRPRVINAIEPLADGILMAYWPGCKGADAIVNTLLGKNNPSGKLPFTYPRHVNELITYDHKPLDIAEEVAEPYSYKFNFAPQYEFGHGLSYSKITYSNLIIDRDTLIGSDTINVNISVENLSSTPQIANVDLFSSDLVASIAPPVKRLRKFISMKLNGGETKTIQFQLTALDLSFINKDLDRVTEDGDFKISIAEYEIPLYYKTN